MAEKALTRLRNLLNLELQTQWRGRAFRGGVPAFCERWAADAEADGTNPGLLREVVERLIRLRLVQREMDLAGFVGATDAQVRQQMDFMRRQSGGAARLQQALANYGLSETILENFIRQQLDFQLFVGFRFRTGLVIPREEVEAYYATEFRSQLPAFSSPPPLERVYEDLEAELVERRVDPLLNDWINRVRSQTRIMIVERSPASAVTESP